MEEYKAPKMFPDLREKVDAKIDQPKKQGGWVKLKKGPKDSKEAPAVSVAPQDMHGESSSLPSGTEMQQTQSGFRPGDQFFFEKASFVGGESPDVDVKSITKDGEVLSFEKGAKHISIDSPEKFARKIGTADGLKYDEIGKSQDDRAFGRGLLDKLNRSDISSIERRGYDDEQNQMLRIVFLMQRRHLEELVLGYEKKLAERADVSRDMEEIKVFAKTILDDFSFETEAGESNGSIQSRRGRKPRQKKMRLNEAEKPKGSKRNLRGGKVVSSAETIAFSEPIVSGIENGVFPQDVNGENDPSADFRYLLSDAATLIDTKILGAQTREDISFISFRVLPDGMRVFVEMTEENGLKRIHKQLIDQGKKADASKLKREWIVENHRLETEYLRKKLLVEILSSGAESMARIDRAPNSKSLQHIGQVVSNRDSGERIFIPSDPVGSKDDPSGTENIRFAIQDLIGAWRDMRVSGQKEWKSFEEYFRKEFSSLIMDSNKQIRKFWEEKRAIFPKRDEREKPGPAKRVRKGLKSERSQSSEMIDPVALERDALQAAERYFTDEAIPAIEVTLQEAGVDLIWLLGDGEYNQQILDFVLKEVGVNIVALATRYTGQLPKEKRSSFEEKIRKVAKDALVEMVMEKISRMLESKSPETESV